VAVMVITRERMHQIFDRATAEGPGKGLLPPAAVTFPWAVASHAYEGSACYVTVDTPTEGRTRWTLLGHAGPDLIVIEGISDTEGLWTAGTEGHVKGTATAEILPLSEVARLNVLNVEAVPLSNDYDLRSRWQVTLCDGRQFSVPRTDRPDEKRVREFMDGFRRSWQKYR